MLIVVISTFGFHNKTKLQSIRRQELQGWNMGYIELMLLICTVCAFATLASYFVWKGYLRAKQNRYSNSPNDNRRIIRRALRTLNCKPVTKIPLLITNIKAVRSAFVLTRTHLLHGYLTCLSILFMPNSWNLCATFAINATWIPITVASSIPSKTPTARHMYI